MIAVAGTFKTEGNLQDQLKKLCPGGVRFNESLRGWTTFRCRSQAAVLVTPQTLEETVSVMRSLHSENREWRVIGRGSNILVRDGGYPGVLLDLSAAFSEIEILTDDGNALIVRVGGGIPNGRLLDWLKTKELKGFGWSFGIPGSVGGGIRMNAGTPLGSFSDILERVEAIQPDGEMSRFAVTPKDFLYRDFPKGHNLVITGGVFRFQKSDLKAVEEEIEKAKGRRKNQPLELPNIGSVFKNPEGKFAGQLIEDAGLKGLQVGDARISERHGNFIVNLGNASTADALRLIGEVEKEIDRKFGIRLQREVHVMGVDP